MSKRFLQSLQVILVSLDLLSLNAIFITASVHFEKDFIQGFYFQYSILAFFLNFSWLFSSWLKDIYKEGNIATFEYFAKKTSRAYVYFLLITLTYLFFYHQFIISRRFVIVILVSFSMVLALNRFLYLGIFSYFKKKGYFLNNVLIIGYNDLSKRLVGYLESNGTYKSILGYCEDSSMVHELSAYPILSDIDDTLNTCKQFDITEIYSTISPSQNPKIYDLINDADKNCIRFKLVPDINLFLTKYGQIDYLNDLPVISIRKEPLEDLGNKIKKRSFDTLFSIVVIVFILSWLVPLIAILIKLTSKGPVFFTQNRLGKNKIPFKVFKFRSMKVSPIDAGFLQATKNDPRVSSIGKFLRRSSLDELPQFFNVLLGQMSICGPRPHPIKLNDTYKKVIDKYMVRQFLKPGITGWAQVNGYRGETQHVELMEKRIEYDLWYLENWSLWFDVKIVFLTVVNMIRGDKNAY